MVGPQDVRVSIYRPNGTLLIEDAGQYLGSVDFYENTPAGCGAAQLTWNLNYKQAYARGFLTARTIIEISSGDDTLQAPILSGATKLYVTGKDGYDTAKGHDDGLVYLFDGATLTMRIPVTGVGTDGGGDYITVGSPLGGGTIPAYAAGTLLGRRRYAGRVAKRQLRNQKFPQTVVFYETMLNRLKEARGSFSAGSTASVDAGAAMYAFLNQFFQAGRFPELTLASFPTVGSTYIGSATDISAASMCSNVLNSISNGDRWEVYVGADRVVRLTKVFDGTTDSYTYTIGLPQGMPYFEPTNVSSLDEDTSSLYNSLKVIGAQDPATKQPVTAIGQDATSITEYGQIDAQPVNNLSIKTEADAQKFVTALLKRYSAPRSSAECRVYTGPYAGVTQRPLGLDRGDVILGRHALTITRFESGDDVRNMVPDSEFQWTAAPDNLWTLTGPIAQVAGVGPGGSDVLRVVGTGSPISASGASSYMDAVPGTKLVVSGQIDGTHVTSGTPSWRVLDSTLTTVIESVAQGVGSDGRVSAIFEVPTGVTKIVAMCDTMGCTIASGQNLDFSQPQIELYSAGFTKLAAPIFLDELGALDTSGFLDAPITVLPDATDYVANYGAPPLTGLVMSVRTTIKPTGEMYQDVQFSAIEPDWNDVAAQRANAMQTALLADQIGTPSLDQYFVAPNAWPSGGPPSSGLVVSPPAFLAVFARGTQPVTVGGNTFTLPAWSTSWAWVSSSNTWTIKQDTSFVPGAILYGMFTTDGTSVMGPTQKAVPGTLIMPMSYMAGDTTLVPTLAGAGPYITAGATGLVSTNLDLAFEITNQPTDGSLSKIMVYYQKVGSSDQLLLGSDVARDAAGSQLGIGATSASGTYAFHFPDAANGASYEFFVAMESGASKESARTSLGTVTVSNGQVGPPASGNSLYRKRFNYGTSSNGALQPGTDDSFSPISAYAGSMQLSSLFPVTLPGVTHPGISLQAEYQVEVTPGAGAQTLSGSVITDADHIDIGLDGTIVDSLSASSFAQSWSATIPDDSATHTLVLHIDKGGTAGTTITLSSEWTAFFPTTSDGRIDATKFATISPT